MTLPRFTFVLPVHNGGEYIKICLQSILSQEQEDFEVVVLENSSNDGTWEWLQKQTDTRLRLYRSENLLSIEENWSRFLSLDKSEFSVFVCHDDYLHPQYLSYMDNLIGAYPDATLYYSNFTIVNAEGHSVRSIADIPATETACDFITALFQGRESYATGYLFRSLDYDRLGGIPQFKNLLYADHALWLNLIGDSYKATSDHNGFFFRVHEKSTTKSSSWQVHINALGQFVDFLCDFRKRNTGVDEVLKSIGPEHFVQAYGHWYRIGLRQANDENKRIPDPIVKNMFAQLRKFGVGLDAVLLTEPIIKRQEWINRNPLLRCISSTRAKKRQSG